MDSYSGIVTTTEENMVEHFTDFTPIPCKGYNSLCKARRYGRWWILKGLKAEYRDQPTYQALLHKEFDILISLQHPNIVAASAIESIEEMGICIVMEWIDGITLQEWINSKKEGDENIFLQLLDAVGYCHAKQIVHRDLKPSNIIITRNGNHVKLIDFGLADTDSYAILKQPAGTLSYMSPEQKIAHIADFRNDIYSLGCILERMQLGKNYMPIANRCKAAIELRYTSIDELRADFVAHGKRKHSRTMVVVGMAVVIAALITLFGMSIYRPYSKRNVNSTTYYNKQDIRKSQPTYRRNNQEKISEEIEQYRDYSTPNTALIIAEGKRQIDQMWRETGIDTMRSIEAKSEAIYRFVNKSNQFITSTYPKTFSNKTTESQKTDVVYELSAYTSERYIQTTLNSIHSSE